ncbi:hypothetical protein H2200_005116 [Cladophialophora chaetospira]|uniref:BZIP domain-containing protein n=1 Tax=Cladophialophora chaetospira TaxID=386627 RepID=A0AA38XC06_9EURO|nr:hypothetical protein H2200_005116 [Cladophialophora chaetospira]
MRCKRQLSTSSAENANEEKPHRKGAISQARRDQNRRAQRAFRERRRTKKRYPLSSAPRPLVPRPREEDLNATERSSDSSGSNTSDPISVDDGLQDQQKPNSAKVAADAFTFSSPQTLLPTQKSLVPRRRTPYSDLLNLMRDQPRYALLPHGVTATLAACLFNGSALGIDIDQIMDPHYMSPFYRDSDAAMQSIASTVQATALDVSPGSNLADLGPLRPCFAQVIFPHHACVDLLPLPRLRELAVMLNVRAQQDDHGGISPGYDGLQDLKKDVYIRQGVRFRGMGELMGDEYVMHDGGGRHCGHPWESGSWAVALWFARKWRYLVDI